MIWPASPLLGYVGWQFWGDHVAVAQDQEENVTDAAGGLGSRGGEERRRRGRGARGGRRRWSGSPGSADLRGARAGGHDRRRAGRGFGHFEDSAGPGQQGNYALAAHRITHGEPLRRMPDLRAGDKVVVETRTAAYTYELDHRPARLVVPFTAGWVVDALPDNPEQGGVEPDQGAGQRLITLTTCSEIFHTDDRLVAFGHL